MRRPTAAQRQAARRRRAQRHEHRLGRFAFLSVIAFVAVLTLALTAFDGSSASRVPATAPAPAQRLLPVGSPQPLVIAKLGELRLQLPISPKRVTAIGYHAAGDGALALTPVGRQANEDSSRGSDTSSSAAGAPARPGTRSAAANARTRAGSTSVGLPARRSTHRSTVGSWG
jgi:hypothetical protein